MSSDGESPQEEIHSLQTSRLAGQIDPSILPYLIFSTVSGAKRRRSPQSVEHNEYWDLFKQIVELGGTSSHKIPHSSRQSFWNLPLHEQLTAFQLSQQLTKHQSRIRWQIAVEILYALRKEPENRKCDAIVFWSLLTGLSDPSSDIDISVDIDGDMGQALRRKKEEERKRIILEFCNGLAEILKNARTPHEPEQKRFSNVQYKRCSFDYIQLQEAETRVTVTLSFDNRHYMRNSKLLQFYINFEPRTKQLIIFLIYWSKFHNILGRRKLNKWAWTVLILVFLMEKRMIPSVLLLQAIAAMQCSQRRETGNQDAYDSFFCDDREVVNKYFTPAVVTSPTNTPQEDANAFFELLADFFETVVSTCYSSSLVSPHIGKVVRKDDVTETASKCVDALPTEMRDCWNKLNPTYFKSMNFLSDKGALFILDPFELYLNTARQGNKNIPELLVAAAKQTLYVLRNHPSTFLEFFKCPAKTPGQELRATAQKSSGDGYIQILLEMFSQPKSEEARIQMETTANEILQKFGDSLVIPCGLFRNTEQFDILCRKISKQFLQKYIAKLYSLDMLGGSNDISSWQLAWQVTALWRFYTLEFLKDIFTTGLKLTAVEVPNSEFDDICRLTSADSWTCDMFTQNMIEHWRKTMGKKSSAAYSGQEARKKLNMLWIPENAIKYGVFKLKVTYPFWKRTFVSHKPKIFPLDKEAKTSLDSYNSHMEETKKSAEAAAFIPFHIFVLYKLDARADRASQLCGESSITFLIQEASKDDVPHEVQHERKLARKCIIDILERTFEFYQQHQLADFIKNGIKM